MRYNQSCRRMARLYVGIDAGGSGTRAALASADGEVLGVGAGGPSNHLTGEAGRQRLHGALASAIEPLVPLAGDGVCVVHAGITGVSIPGKRENVIESIRALLPRAVVHVSHDASAAVVGALAGHEGVGVLAGTGAIALARTADGREARAGGYGYLLSDEGAAFGIAQRAVAEVMRAVDGRGPATRLGELFRRHLGLDDVRRLPGWLYAAADPVERLCPLAPLVALAADQGDQVALSVLEQAGTALADVAAAAARLLWSSSVPHGLPIATCGGVWKAGTVLRQPFERALRRQLPDPTITTPAMSPIAGALLLAMWADGLTLETERVQRVGKSMREHLDEPVL
jgi:N-acetylglucosamine kinase-like BadF-type ATPase